MGGHRERRRGHGERLHYSTDPGHASMGDRGYGLWPSGSTAVDRGAGEGKGAATGGKAIAMGLLTIATSSGAADNENHLSSPGEIDI